MFDDPGSPESRILDRLKRVEDRIRGLQAEKAALERLLTDFRKDDPRKRESGRKRSIKKAVTEERILSMLRETHRPLSSGQIHSRLEASGEASNYSTIRSYIRRLAMRGLIEQAPAGKWKISSE